jgi:opacity protein-like surface antigen
MRRVFAASVAIAVAGGSAWAADLPAKAPSNAAPASAPASTWTGCYFGGHVGGGWGTRDFFNPAGLDLTGGLPLFGVNSLLLNQAASGFVGGAQAGCRYEFDSRWVIGLEGEFSGTHLVGERLLAPTPFGDPLFQVPTTVSTQTDWIASATAALGYSVNGLLLYAKGGAAWTHNRYNISADLTDFAGFASANFQAQDTRTGWTAGAGVEYPVWNNFTAKIEYDYYDFGTKAVLFVDQLSSPSSLGTIDVKQRIHAVKLGFNYYFWNVPAKSTALSARAAVEPDITWNKTFSAEVRYNSWQGTRGVPTNFIVLGNVSSPLTSRGTGAELYIPYAAQLVGQGTDLKIEMLLRGGWVWARQSTAGLTGTIGTATDTVASGTVTYLGLKGIQPFVSLDLNLPTGASALTPTQVNARMDPDLVDIATFGEGLNVGPTFGVNVPLSDAWLVTTSVGYTHRGIFEMEGALTPPNPNGGGIAHSSDITPGDVLTATGVLGYQAGPLSAKLTGTITQNGDTKQDDVPVVRSGRRYLIAGTASYNWPSEHVGTTTLNASAAHNNRNEVLFQCLTGCPTALVTEPFNTNSNLYQLGLEHLFAFDKWSVGPKGSFLFRDNNGYEPTTLQFVPAKERWSAGVLAQYAPNQILAFNARVERVWTREQDTPGLPNNEMLSVLAGSTVTAFTVPVISSNGWQFAVGATASF